MSERRRRAEELDGLRPNQSEAINCLLAGMTKTATANAIGVHRVTLSNWMRNDPAMRAELNRRLKERGVATSARVQSLVNASLDVLEESIKRDRDAKVAVAFLRLVGSQGYLVAPTTGPATFEEAALEIAVEQEHRRDAFHLVFGDKEPMSTDLLNDLILLMLSKPMHEDPTPASGGGSEGEGESTAG